MASVKSGLSTKKYLGLHPSSKSVQHQALIGKTVVVFLAVVNIKHE